jgi:hypothetical protein
MLKSEAFKGQKIKVTSGEFKDKKGYIMGMHTQFACVQLTDEEYLITACLEYGQLEPFNLRWEAEHPYPTPIVPCPDVVTLSAPAHYDEHYASMVGLEPIELMQLVLSLPEFVGFLKGNIIKYTMRAGKKQGEAAEKDAAKAKRYIEWLMKLGYKMPINPKED